MTNDAMQSVGSVLTRAVASHPDKTWIVAPDREISFAKAELETNRIANALQVAGVVSGKPVLVMLPDDALAMLLWVSLAKLGVVDVPVNTAYVSNLLAHVINDSGAEVLICGPEFVDRVLDIEQELHHLSSIYVVEEPDRGVARVVETSIRVSSFFDLDFSNTRSPGVEVNGANSLSIIYTSGTTGASKGVETSHAHAYAYASQAAKSVKLTEHDVYYSCGLPLFHVLGRWACGYATLIHRATMIIPKKFSVSSFWSDIRSHNATVTALAGTMGSLLQNQPASDRDGESTLSRALMFPLVEDYQGFSERFGVALASAYGSTESGCPTILPAGQEILDRRCVGKVNDALYDIRVADELDRPVGVGEIGQILVRSKVPWIIMKGYWKNTNATTDSWRNLWFQTGDAGFFDADNRLHFVDRMRDCIRRRGENVSCGEVEAIVHKHPDVLECAIYAVPSALTEDDIMLSAILQPNSEITESLLADFLRAELPGFMVPRYIEFVFELPKTPTGKVKKKELSDRPISTHVWDNEAPRVARQKQHT